MLEQPPSGADLMLAFEMDPKTRDVHWDPEAGTGTMIDLATKGFAPTGYYVSLVMYYYGL